MTDIHAPWRRICKQLRNELDNVPEPRLIEKSGRRIRYYFPAADGVADVIIALRKNGYSIGWEGDLAYVEVEA